MFVAKNRSESKAKSTRAFAKMPHRFVQIAGKAIESTIIVPRVSSENRQYYPVNYLTKDFIIGDSAQAIYDAPLWNFSIVASKLHLTWIATVCGKLENRFRYSNTLGWNTFPIPKLTEKNINDRLKKEIKKCLNIFSLLDIKNIFSEINAKEVVGLDFSHTTYYFLDLLEKNKIKYKEIINPCILSKAIKNKTEQKGALDANLRDGVSITRFIYWLKNEMDINSTDELIASNHLESLRVKNKFFHSLSFDTISAFGKNAALPHYRVDKSSNTKFKLDNIYLVDSGAQYYDGTTDITRTIILGNPNEEQKDRFTRVLKGHIALSSHVFKKGTKGNEIDYLARESLKEIDCDYDHGTGHGIGSFLSVHEAPQRIAKNSMFDSVELKPGMILSNEPGYYKLGEYGIRIENLILIKEKTNGTLYFENLSWCPIDMNLVKKDLLSKKEIEWLNSYHLNVFTKLKSYMNNKEKSWLKFVTKEI